MTVRAFGPGRVNLIGEHTDYNGGLALPFAIREGVTVGAEPADGDELDVHALDADERDAFALDAIEPAEGWRAFVRGVAAELQDAGHVLRGARVTIEGSVPQGGGLSSSAALEAALSLALLAVAGEAEPDRVALVELCSRVENRWVGSQTGLLDQTASLRAADGHAIRIDFASMDITPVPLELGDWRLATLDSGQAHSLAHSGYNDRREECARAAELLGVAHLADADPEALDALPGVLADRARHVLEEDARVEATVAALRAADLDRVGELLDASHASLRDLFAVSTDAVEDAVARAKAAGAAGARLMGGGFGGHVLMLLPPGARPPEDAHEVAPGPPARLL